MVKRKKRKKSSLVQKKAPTRSWKISWIPWPFSSAGSMIISEEPIGEPLSVWRLGEGFNNQEQIQAWFMRVLKHYGSSVPDLFELDQEIFNIFLAHLPLSAHYEIVKQEVESRKRSLLQILISQPEWTEGYSESSENTTGSAPAPTAAPEAEPKAEPKAKVKAESKAKARAKAKAEPKAKVKAEPKVDSDSAPVGVETSSAEGLEAFLARCRSTYEAGPSLPEEEARLGELQLFLADESSNARCREELQAFLETVNERKRFPRSLKKALAS